MKQIKQQQSGFALLMALIVVGVVVSVGLTILDLTIKQLNLSTNSKDSEIALHASNAGLECAQYWRFKEATKFESGQNLSIECFNVTESSGSVTDLDLSSGGSVYEYNFEFDWGTSGVDERCSKIKMLMFASDVDSSGATLNNISSVVLGYPSGTNKTCDSGGRCAVISVQGYNKTCGDIGSFGTIQREVLLES